MLLIRTLLVLFVLAAGAQSVSAAEAWRIVASTGAVKSGAPGVMPVAVNSKQTLPADSWVETAATGRIVVARGYWAFASTCATGSRVAWRAAKRLAKMPASRLSAAPGSTCSQGISSFIRQ